MSVCECARARDRVDGPGMRIKLPRFSRSVLVRPPFGDVRTPLVQGGGIILVAPDSSRGRESRGGILVRILVRRPCTS